MLVTLYWWWFTGESLLGISHCYEFSRTKAWGGASRCLLSDPAEPFGSNSEMLQVLCNCAFTICIFFLCSWFLHITACQDEAPVHSVLLHPVNFADCGEHHWNTQGSFVPASSHGASYVIAWLKLSFNVTISKEKFSYHFHTESCHLLQTLSLSIHPLL